MKCLLISSVSDECSVKRSAQVQYNYNSYEKKVLVLQLYCSCIALVWTALSTLRILTMNSSVSTALYSPYSMMDTQRYRLVEKLSLWNHDSVFVVTIKTAAFPRCYFVQRRRQSVAICPVGQ